MPYKDKEKVKEYQGKYYINNCKKLIKQTREYQKKNKERISERVKEHNKNNKVKEHRGILLNNV